MSTRQRKRKQADAENKDPQRRKNPPRKTVSDLDEECNVNKGTHDNRADEEVQSPAESVLEEHSGPPAIDMTMRSAKRTKMTQASRKRRMKSLTEVLLTVNAKVLSSIPATEQGLHPETNHLLKSDVTMKLELLQEDAASLSTMVGPHAETKPLLTADVATTLIPDGLSTTEGLHPEATQLVEMDVLETKLVAATPLLPLDSLRHQEQQETDSSCKRGTRNGWTQDPRMELHRRKSRDTCRTEPPGLQLRRVPGSAYRFW